MPPVVDVAEGAAMTFSIARAEKMIKFTIEF